VEPLRVGVIGCGTISGAYLKNMSASPHLKVVTSAGG
jgi:predicted dehydrogenase